MRRARGQMKGPFAFPVLPLLVALAACGGQADAVPAAPAPAQAPAPASAPAPATAASPAPGPAGAAIAPVDEATCATAPLRVRVVGVRQETADSIRVELTLANLAPPAGWTPGSPAAASVRAAVAALEGLSMVSADGRRRMFTLRDSTGQRVGAAVPAPVPGAPATFWVMFPAAEGPVSLFLPGFEPLSGLAVVPLAARSEP
jgi:pyruvate dehydrogenase E2 component (dihydrolipoamide acetyltransferase)